MRFSPAFFSVASCTALLLPLSALGCGDEGSSTTSAGGEGGTGGATATGGTGGDTGTDTGGSAFVMTPHPPFPVIDGDNAFVIASPKLVTITFQGNADTSKIQAMGDALVVSSWAAAVGADYGVGAGTHFAKVVLPEPAPASLSDPDLLALIDQHIQDGLIPAPAPDIIYMAYISAKTDFDDGEGSHICDSYYGYHWQADVPSGTLTYAIIGDCGVGFDEVTATASHEYIETASDPGFEGGYYLQLFTTDPWYSQDGQENADLCDYAGYVTEGGFTYQRVWSNSAAAAAVTSPCAPIDPQEVFYDVFADPSPIPSLAGGESATFTLTGWSTAPIPDWPLTYDEVYYSEFKPIVELSATTINNGGTVTLKLTVPPGTPKGRLGTAMMFSGEGYGRFWPVSVRSK